MTTYDPIGPVAGHEPDPRQDQPRRRARSSLARVAAALVGALLILVGAAPARAQKSPLAAAAVNRAEAHLSARRYADAIREFQAAVRYEPRFALGWYLLASSYRHAGDFDRAVAAYRRYGELRPGEPHPHYGIGLCLQAVGDRAGARAELEQYAAMAGLDPRVSARRFADEARTRARELAQTAPAATERPGTGPGTGTRIAEARADAPQPEALARARKLGMEHRSREAAAAYKRWLEENPKAAPTTTARAEAELGSSLLLVGEDATGAVAALRAATRLDPVDARAWYNLAFALRRAGSAPQAVDAYFRYITLEWKDPDPYYGLGQTLSSLGRRDEALTALRTYVSLEKRPTEQRWVRTARLEIARLAAAAEATTSNPRPSMAEPARREPSGAPPDPRAP